MRELKRKWRNGKGFTLIEMLIVVAIIAILVAVSIPLIGNALEKTREATDKANERAAKAEAIIAYMTGADIPQKNNSGVVTGSYKFQPNEVYCYNNVTGSIERAIATNSGSIAAYGQSAKCKGAKIYLYIDVTTLEVHLGWYESYGGTLAENFEDNSFSTGWK